MGRWRRLAVWPGDRGRRAQAIALAAAGLALVASCAAPEPRPTDVPDPSLVAELNGVGPAQLRGLDDRSRDPDAVNAYWDTARLLGATPVDAAPRGRPASSVSPPASGELLARDPTYAEAQDPDGNAVPSGGAAASGAAAAAAASEVGLAPRYNGRGPTGSTTGRLFFTNGGRPRSCTATVISSNSRALAVTAGHCLLSDGTAGPRLPSRDLLFVPGYDDGRAPYGRWTALSFEVTRGWENNLDWSQDVGFVRLRWNLGLAQTALGSLGIRFGAVPSEPRGLLGYPAVLPYTGDVLRQCPATAPAGPDPAAPAAFALTCPMTAGYSGGPAITQPDPAASPYVVGVGSHDYNAGVVYLAPLGAGALEAYQRADLP